MTAADITCIQDRIRQLSIEVALLKKEGKKNNDIVYQKYGVINRLKSWLSKK